MAAENLAASALEEAKNLLRDVDEEDEVLRESLPRKMRHSRSSRLSGGLVHRTELFDSDDDDDDDDDGNLGQRNRRGQTLQSSTVPPKHQPLPHSAKPPVAPVPETSGSSGSSNKVSNSGQFRSENQRNGVSVLRGESAPTAGVQEREPSVSPTAEDEKGAGGHSGRKAVAAPTPPTKGVAGSNGARQTKTVRRSMALSSDSDDSEGTGKRPTLSGMASMSPGRSRRSFSPPPQSYGLSYDVAEHGKHPSLLDLATGRSGSRGRSRPSTGSSRRFDRSLHFEGGLFSSDDEQGEPPHRHRDEGSTSRSPPQMPGQFGALRKSISPEPSKSGRRSKEGKKTMWVIRHGDREDTSNQKWEVSMKLLDGERRREFSADPPLSSCGVQQAMELGSFLKKEGINRLVSSPYLRTLQTSQYVAWKNGLYIEVEPGVCETPHNPANIPGVEDRFGCIPSIDLAHRSWTSGPDAESDELECLPRSIDAAQGIVSSMRDGDNVAVITHASIAMAVVASLASDCRRNNMDQDRAQGLRRTLERIEAASPCGVYKLEFDVQRKLWTSDLKCYNFFLSQPISSTKPWRFSIDFSMHSWWDKWEELAYKYACARVRPSRLRPSGSRSPDPSRQSSETTRSNEIRSNEIRLQTFMV